MSSPCSLLRLPNELRFAIYRAYFALPGGYILSSDLRRLTTSNKEPIDLNLIYTCKLVAQETCDLPFNLNSITFSTIFSDYLNLAAVLLYNFLLYASSNQTRNLERLRTLINADIYTKVLERFPLYKGNLDLLLGEELNEFNSLQIISAHNQNAAAYTLQQIISSYDHEVIDRTERSSDTEDEEGSDSDGTPPWPMDPQLSCDALSKLTTVFLELESWSIPTQTQVNKMAQFFPNFSDQAQVDYTINRFSASSAAISFLQSIPSNSRRRIRNIILNEDHFNLNLPQKHGEGFIPFCKENPQLRIQRRISLWRTVFPRRHVQGSNSFETALERSSREAAMDMGIWCVWALYLPSQGMPENSMTTFFDGDPAPDLCSDIFQTYLHRDIAWMHAFKKRFAQVDKERCLLRDSYFKEHVGEIELVAKHLRQGSTAFDCNFDPGQECEVAAVEEESAHLSYVQWIYQKWDPRPIYQYQSYPKWKDTLRENFFTEDEFNQSIQNARQSGFPMEAVCYDLIPRNRALQA